MPVVSTSPAGRISKQHRSTGWRAACVAFFAMAGLALLSTEAIRGWIVDDAGREEVLVARLAAQQIDQTIRTAKIVLDGAAVRFTPNAPVEESARRAIQEMGSRIGHEPQFVGLKIVDASGNLLASTAEEAIAPVEPPDFFVGALREPDNFHIGHTQESTIDRRPVMTVGRRVDGADGSPLAVIGLSIDLARLRQVADDTLSLRNRTLLAIRSDGVALFRLPDPGFGIAGTDMSDRPAFRRVAAGERTGHYTAPSPLDGVVRVGGFALSPDEDIIVLAARAERDVLRHALLNRGQVALWFGAGLIAAVAFGAYAAAELRRRRKLIAQREDLLHCLNLADAGITIADAETQALRFVNPAFERMTGYSAADAIGKNCRFLQGPATDQATVARIREKLRSGEPVRVDILNYRKNGTPYWSDLNIAPIRASDGTINGFVSTFLDVTERVRMTADLNDALARAHAADSSKSTFLARMSHELRTPLNAIIGFAEVMRLRLMGPLSDRYVDYASSVHESGRHLLALVESVLEMSRLEADARSFERTTIDLADVARTAATLAQPAIDGAAMRLELDIAERPTAEGDATALRQIAVNLLVNAARHGRTGGTIRVRAYASKDGRARLEVLDDGPGIAPELLAKLGTPFLGRRADTADGGGMGLGLAISMELAKRMGGSLEIANANPGVRATLDMPSLADAGDKAA